MTEMGLIEVGPCEVGTSEICACEVCSAEIDPSENSFVEASLTKIYIYPWMFFSPLVPYLHSFSEYIEMFLVCHTMILSIYTCKSRSNRWKAR